MSGFEVITVGRCGIDLYPLRTGVPLAEVDTFGRFLGGTAANVAVAAARLGRRTALLTRTGADPFGDFVHAALAGYGVDDRFVTPVAHLKTPITFCEIFPPDRFPIYFYREPRAPDLEIHPDELDLEALAATEILWLTGTGLSDEPSRAAHHVALGVRETGITVLDLDYRAVFWESPQHARAAVRSALETGAVTVAVGNAQECAVATGEDDPHRAADALLAMGGVRLAVVKLGPDGVLARDRDGTEVHVPGVPVEVVNGLGAGDAFGGALCHGLLAGWSPRDTLRFASAAGAIVASRLACSAAMPTADEVDALMRTPPGQREPAVRIAGLAAHRAGRPGAVAEAALSRRRPDAGWGERRLMIIAADHPARGVTGVRDRPYAMASRADLLERLRVALHRPGVHGLLGTADIIEDLLLLGELDGKVVIGSMNRGGLAGSTFELDDRFTGYDAQTIEAMGYDGGKMLCRIDPDDPATVSTLESCGRAVTDLARRGLMAMVEPLPVVRSDGRARLDPRPDPLVRAVGIAQALGATSAYTWLKLPVVDEMERVLAATTLPVLLLGGDAAPDQAYAGWHKALRNPAVRGLVVGRALLYPADDDVAAAVDAAAALL